jgi:hypothetical protein
MWFGRKADRERERESDRSFRKGSDVGRWLPYLASGPALGLVAIVLYAWHANSSAVFAIALLVGGGAFLAGGLLGFLFGIPRLLATTGAVAPTNPNATEAAKPQSSPYAPNTNLEQISDWLTKILVGVGLVELGKLTDATRRLVNFLEPSLGGAPNGSAFALGLLTLYSISGFLIVYLVTRVYLGRAFAEADQLTRRLDRLEAAQEQQERDVQALSLATRQLDPDGPAEPISQDALNEAMKAASDVVRVQIFNMARQARRKGTTAQTTNAPAVFSALIAADTGGRWHRNHAQLGYALYDAHDYANAEAALTTAIDRRTKAGQRGFDLYEYVRAQARIAQDPADKTASPSDPDVRDAILDDLREAYKAGFLRRDIQADKRVQSWLKRNQLAADDLAS